MDKVIEYEKNIFSKFDEFSSDLLIALERAQINNKVGVTNRLKIINESLEEINNSINSLLIDIHKNNINVPEKEIDRMEEDENWKKVLTTFMPTMFLYNMYLNNDAEHESDDLTEFQNSFVPLENIVQESQGEVIDSADA